MNLGFIDPYIHDLMEDPIELMGLRFPNTIGLAAGFDYEAKCVSGLGGLGFGHIEVGSVSETARPIKKCSLRRPSHSVACSEGIACASVERVIENLKSAAPLPAVQKAFANAFGDTLEVTVDKDGKMQAVATLQNMIINMGSEYYANVLTIANGTTLSTKVEKSTQGMGGETLEVEVPEKISFELPQLDENNSTVLSITVDFMNYFMGQGKDYPTNVTLTLDLDNAKELQKEYVLEDGTYDVPVNVLKENSDDQSMAAQAVESAQITVQNNEVVVTLKLKEMTMYGQTASVDKMEYQLKDGTYKEATVIEEEDRHPNNVQFKLDENKEVTNVKFYYGGSSRGAIARLQLKLDGLTKVDPTPETPKDDEDKKDEENTSRFTKDGTYSVDVALWNATSDKESMAASAIDSKANIIVKDGKATMYLSTKEMSFGSIKASLQEFYIGSEQEDYKNHGKRCTRESNIMGL